MKDENICEPLLSLIRQYRPRQNSGNTTARGVPKEELEIMLQETGPFWLRINRVADDSPYDNDDDDDDDDDDGDDNDAPRPVVYMQYTLTTFKKKARKAGKTLKELETKNGFVLLEYK